MATTRRYKSAQYSDQKPDGATTAKTAASAPVHAMESHLWSSTFAEARRLEEAKTLENMLQQANAQSDAEKGEFEAVRKRLEGQYRSVQEECRILQNLCDEGKERWQEAEREREKQVQRCEELLDREKKIQSELQALMRQVHCVIAKKKT